MRIGLNLLHASPRIGGGWNYISNLMQALESVDDENEYVLFTNHSSQALLPPKKNFTTVAVNIGADDRVQRVLYEQTMLQPLAQRQHLDLMHWFANMCGLRNAVRPIVTVYDLLAFREPHRFSVTKGLYLRTMIRLSAEEAFLLPMSGATATDLTNILGVSDDRMKVIPAPIPDEFHQATQVQIESFKKKYSLPDMFWVYVAHYNPHKNHRRLLEAYARLTRQSPTSWPLVLRGETKDEPGIPGYISEFGLQKNVVELPRLDAGEMPLLYGSATALVFPSLFEGGGMPLMEAMSCGCPVAASDIPTTNEFGADAVLKFDGKDVASIYEAMLRLQTDSDLRARLRSAGLKQGESFSMKKIGLDLKTTYLEVGHGTITD